MSTPKLPAHLTGHARTEWKRMIRVLTKKGTLEESDQRTIELYCEAYSDWRIAKDKVAKTGPALLSQDKDGKPVVKRNPYYTAKNNAHDRCVKLLIELGLTPSSRKMPKKPPTENPVQLGGAPIVLKFKEQA